MKVVAMLTTLTAVSAMVVPTMIEARDPQGNQHGRPGMGLSGRDVEARDPQGNQHGRPGMGLSGRDVEAADSF
ncbi:uncharacterized protein BROUX77_000219 [Berkeleyomyces rouxiae]|uniref:uncharacterized protein n=1 Tax=Berkeleyomyces rouxiae TaxID=2035830 RepID=UPI003B7A5395